jgi:hypothetical protein
LGCAAQHVDGHVRVQLQRHTPSGTTELLLRGSTVVRERAERIRTTQRVAVIRVAADHRSLRRCAAVGAPARRRDAQR